MVSGQFIPHFCCCCSGGGVGVLALLQHGVPATRDSSPGTSPAGVHPTGNSSPQTAATWVTHPQGQSFRPSCSSLGPLPAHKALQQTCFSMQTSSLHGSVGLPGPCSAGASHGLKAPLRHPLLQHLGLLRGCRWISAPRALHGLQGHRGHATGSREICTWQSLSQISAQLLSLENSELNPISQGFTTQGLG